MALAQEHLGADVQCPHCQSVVKTEAPPPVVDLVEHTESIFAEPPPSDALFGDDDDAPKVLMPEDDMPRIKEKPRLSPSPSPLRRPAPRESSDEEPVDLAAMSKSNLPAKRDTIGPLMVTLLVPYAIFCIAVIAYLLVTWPDPQAFDHLPDPNPKVKPTTVHALPIHNGPVPAKNIVSVGNSVRVGGIEISPLSIKLTPAGDLRLQFRARNVSADQSFIPIESEFFRTAAGKPPKHYTFLEQRNGNSGKVFGGELDFGGRRNSDLQPGAETVITLTTDQKSRAAVKDILTGQRFLWRLQVRRGTVVFRKMEVPASAVVAVEFTHDSINRQ